MTHALIAGGVPQQLAHTGWVLKTLVFLYVGPDQILPLTSAVGAIIGVLLMFWHRLLGWLRAAWQFCAAKLRAGLKRGA